MDERIIKAGGHVDFEYLDDLHKSTTNQTPPTSMTQAGLLHGVWSIGKKHLSQHLAISHSQTRPWNGMEDISQQGCIVHVVYIDGHFLSSRSVKMNLRGVGGPGLIA
jgi:hypothetical protein